jgi:hypothetical protein
MRDKAAAAAGGGGRYYGTLYNKWQYNLLLCGPYTINHVAQNCFAQHNFAHSRSSQTAHNTVNHVAQHAMLRNMIGRVWAALVF